MLTKAEIENWLTRYNIKNFTIEQDLTVNVDDDVDLEDKALTTLPFRFGVVGGNFACSTNKLSSLEQYISLKCIFISGYLDQVDLSRFREI